MSAAAVDVVVVFKDGVLKPGRDARLTDGLQDRARYRAHLELVAAEAAVDEEYPTGWKTAMALKGCISSTAPDVAKNHDKYLAGGLLAH